MKDIKIKITESVARLTDSVKNIEEMTIEDIICSVGYHATSLVSLLNDADNQVFHSKKMYPIISSTKPLDEVSRFHISEFDNNIKPYCGASLGFDFDISADIFTFRQLLKEGRLCKKCKMVAMLREYEKENENNEITLPNIGDSVLRDSYEYKVAEVIPHRDLAIVASITLRGEGGIVEIGYYDYLALKAAPVRITNNEQLVEFVSKMEINKSYYGIRTKGLIQVFNNKESFNKEAEALPDSVQGEFTAYNYSLYRF